MTPELILALFNTFAPIVRKIIEDHRAQNPNAPPLTDEQITAIFAANIDKYLAEGASWRNTHPNA